MEQNTKTFINIAERLAGLICLSYAMEELTGELADYEKDGVLVNPTPKQRIAMEKRKRISELTTEVNNLAMEFTDTMRSNTDDNGLLLEKGSIVATVAKGLVFVAPKDMPDTDKRIQYILDKNRDKRVKR